MAVKRAEGQAGTAADDDLLMFVELKMQKQGTCEFLGIKKQVANCGARFTGFTEENTLRQLYLKAKINK